MTFVSYEFLLLFGLVVLLCWAFQKQRNHILLVASYIFYGWWDWRFLSLLVASTVVDYACAKGIANAKTKRVRQFLLGISLTLNLGALCIFKYADFFAETLQECLMVVGIRAELPMLNLVLPLGISFYTFQTLSYTVDVYRGRPTAASLLDFMLYVSFFPQLVAGPIERAEHLLPQIACPIRPTWEMIHSGTQLALVGFFKKMVIADNLAPAVNAVYESQHPGGFTILLATYAFAIQIYCDFSGYTDIARGTARILGFELCENFRLPFLSANPREFWQRWHISLSTWIRDYVYIPLGGNRGGAWSTIRNLMITMFLAGLWHGASVHFVIWGLYHGILLSIYQGVQSLAIRNRLLHRFQVPSWLQIFVFFHLTCFGWMVFRVHSMTQLSQFCAGLIDVLNWGHFDRMLAVKVFVAAIPLVGFQQYQQHKNDMEPWRHWSVGVRVLFYFVLFYSIVLLGTPEKNAFIYFQF